MPGSPRRSVLCRRVVRGTGQMMFSVIFVTPGLAAADHQRGIAGGPPFVDTPRPYPDLLSEAGWEPVGDDDLTAEYRATVERMLDRKHQIRDEVERVLDADHAAEIVAQHEARAQALDAGLLRRALFTAVPAAAGQW